MPQSNEADPGKTQVSARVPYAVKEAFSKLAHKRNGEDAFTTVRQSDVQREALYAYLLEVWNELPEDVREDLDRDRLKHEVEEGPGAGV